MEREGTPGPERALRKTRTEQAVRAVGRQHEESGCGDRERLKRTCTSEQRVLLWSSARNTA